VSGAACLPLDSFERLSGLRSNKRLSSLLHLLSLRDPDSHSG
jgi:hypothetical protein